MSGWEIQAGSIPSVLLDTRLQSTIPRRRDQLIVVPCGGSQLLGPTIPVGRGELAGGGFVEDVLPAERLTINNL